MNKDDLTTVVYADLGDIHYVHVSSEEYGLIKIINSNLMAEPVSEITAKISAMVEDLMEVK